MKEENDKRESEKMKQKHDDFLAYVIKDWISEHRLEESITLEFMDFKNRKSTSYMSVMSRKS